MILFLSTLKGISIFLALTDAFALVWGLQTIKISEAMVRAKAILYDQRWIFFSQNYIHRVLEGKAEIPYSVIVLLCH